MSFLVNEDYALLTCDHEAFFKHECTIEMMRCGPRGM